MHWVERRAPCATDTQHIVNLSAYYWATTVLPDLGEMRVLDAACGAGYGSEALARRARAVVGVDRDIGTIREASRRYQRPNLRFLPMDCEVLAFRSGSFDAVVSFETIEHLDGDRQFLQEVARLLAQGGWLVLSTPHGKGAGVVPANPFHRREYTWEECRALLAEFFPSVRLLGRRLGPRLASLEGTLRHVRGLDPRGLRCLVPRRVRHLLGSLISRSGGGAGLEEIITDDVEYVEGLADTSTVVALCRLERTP